MTIFIPIIDISYKESIKVWDLKRTNRVVVCLKDLVTKTGKPTKTYKRIIQSGGLHAFLKYDGNIILSTIMPDDRIKKFYPQKYAKYINNLKPDFYITVDGWTYDKCKESLTECWRTYEETKELIELCPKTIPLGLVKGNSIEQIDMHSSFLLSVGIQDFILHLGDFRRKGNSYYIQQGKSFSSFLRKKSRTLILYGYGSPKELISHSFSDAYISYNYFVASRHGIIYGEIPTTNNDFKQIMKHNYLEMHKSFDKIKKQTKLTEDNFQKWVKADQDQPVIEPEMVVAQALEA